MDFRIAATFTDALTRLTAQDQKSVKDLQLDPSAPGLQMHRIDKSEDPNFCPRGWGAISGSSCIRRRPASWSLMSIITTPPMLGGAKAD